MFSHRGIRVCRKTLFGIISRRVAENAEKGMTIRRQSGRSNCSPENGTSRVPCRGNRHCILFLKLSQTA